MQEEERQSNLHPSRHHDHEDERLELLDADGDQPHHQGELDREPEEQAGNVIGGGDRAVGGNGEECEPRRGGKLGTAR